MSNKRSKIRWRDSDTAELNRLIKNFNAKLYREEKKNPATADYLPSRVKKSEVIKSIETRADFNRLKKSLSAFSKRGAEKPVKSSRGAKATQWEVDEFKKKQKIENVRRTRERNKLNEKEMKSRGKPTGLKRGEMGTVKENSLKPNKKKFENLSQKEWEKAKLNIDKSLNAQHREQKKQTMKDNYIKGLENAGYSDDVIDLVKNTNVDDFMETVDTDTEATFDFIYDPIEQKQKEEALKQVWAKGEK